MTAADEFDEAMTNTVDTREAPSEPTTDAVLEALRDVIDPELGVNIVDLGLVMDATIDQNHVSVTMTLTTPGCPLHGTITRDAELRVGRLPGVQTVHVELVWDPPWTPNRITDAGKRQLGW